eukprot:Gb_03380 [translate_table: standard]
MDKSFGYDRVINPRDITVDTSATNYGASEEPFTPVENNPLHESISPEMPSQCPESCMKRHERDCALLEQRLQKDNVNEQMMINVEEQKVKVHSATAMKQTLKNQEKTTVLLLGPMLQFHARRGTIKTGTTGIKREGNADDCSPEDECVKKKALSEGKLVHAHIKESGFMVDRFLGNTLINLYAKCGNVDDARRVFDRMVERDVFSWTVMIAACSRHGLAEEALTLFYNMQRGGIQPNEFTFASILPVCENLATVKEVHEEIIRSGCQSDVFVASALVDMYAKCRNLENARHVFDRMPERDAVSWTTMIAAYSQNGHVNEAWILFHKMPQRDIFSWNAMLTGYAQNGLVDEALKLFGEMPERDVVSWTAMIAGYTQNGHGEDALKFFRKMQLAGVKPDSKTFISVLPACTNLAALEQGMDIHDKVIKNGFHSDVYVSNTLINMYAKCGSIENACHVFDNIHQPDVISWNTMIGAYAMHGCGKEALKLFEQMQHSGMNPDQVTLVCVLSACCHAGLVDEGWEYFHCMSRSYHITPLMEHYGCMVDLLGRAGRLLEAQELIEKMPVKPNAAVWGCLLGACRIHNNSELGQRAAEHLFELEPKSAAPYVLLSNIYAAAERWDAIGKVRKMMKDKRVEKTPGYSWIRVNKQRHLLRTDVPGGRDAVKPEHLFELEPKSATPYVLLSNIYAEAERCMFSLQTHAELESLYKQIKAAGYVVRFVLNNVEEQQKEHILCHQGEKLTIAFGLINLPTGQLFG